MARAAKKERLQLQLARQAARIALHHLRAVAPWNLHACTAARAFDGDQLRCRLAPDALAPPLAALRWRCKRWRSLVDLDSALFSL